MNFNAIRWVFVLWLITLLCTPLLATGITVTDVEGTEENGIRVEATISWENGWRNTRNYDAAWVFVKWRRKSAESYRHALLAQQGHLVASENPRLSVRVAPDQVGAFLMPEDLSRGRVEGTVRLLLVDGTLGRASLEDVEFKVFAIEMVFIPKGFFYIGDFDPKAMEFAAFYRIGADGKPAGIFPVGSEKPIEVGTEEGQLHYQPGNPEYGGDVSGPIPVGFPKGFNAFYVMKYEITQGQYADFLNTLNNNASYFRANFSGRTYYNSRGSIRFEAGIYRAEAPDRPANFVSWDDGAAFSDWAGLRPMTELEFTKASRGGELPRPNQFPWGTASKERLKRVVQPNDDLLTNGSAEESLLEDSTRDVLGASFYWVMDLAGSVWEKVVTIGHPAGRQFLGTHGDGRLTGHGFATNGDWPSGDDDGGGYGYRGGGHYEHGRPDTEFNPHSPVAYRRFGSWGAAPRYLAYGMRAARTAP